MAFGGTVAIRAMKDGDFVATIFPGTTAGLQAAIDFLAGGKGKVSIGPGTLDITTVISLHGGLTLEGCGAGVTVIRRATGSLTSGDAAYTGNTFITTAFGANGVPNNATSGGLPTAPQSNILISDLTLDGNQSNFGAVNPNTPWNMGMNFYFVAGLSLQGIEVKEFLQTGIQLNSCKNTELNGVRLVNCGQYASASSRNSLTYNNNEIINYAGSWASDHLATNVYSDSPKDVHIDIVNNRRVKISDMTAIKSQVVIEMEADSAHATSMSQFHFENIQATTPTLCFFKSVLASGVDMDDLLVDNCSCYFDATNDGMAVQMTNITGAFTGVRKNIKWRGCVFDNVNALDGANWPMFTVYSSDSGYSEDITIENCKFRGLASSVRTDCPAIYVNGNVRRLSIVDCSFVDIPGIGVKISPYNGFTVKNVKLSGNTLEGCNSDGYYLFVETATGIGTIESAYVLNNTAKDCAKRTGSSGFVVGGSVATAFSVTHVNFLGNRAYKTSGATMTRGLAVVQTAPGVVDAIGIGDNDFSGVTTVQVFTQGAPTTLKFTPPVGRGTDIASGATIAIPVDGDRFHVTGTTNISGGITINPLDSSRVVYLIFDGALTLSDAAPCKLNGDLVTTADDTITLLCDGSSWFELARSVN